MFKQVWTADMIRDIILSAKGKEPLNSHHFSTEHPDVYAAALRFFGSWGEAVSSCGIDYNEVRKYRAWSRSRILAEIRRRCRSGDPLSSQQVQQTSTPLYMAAVHYFKSWSVAIRLAGLDYTSIRVRRSQTPAQIRAEIRRLYKKGEDLAYSNMRRNHQYLLAAGMKKLGDGSWVAARIACGITDNYRLSKAKRLALRFQPFQPELF